MTQPISVLKLDGTVEPFSPQKLLQSATRIGLPKSLHNQLLHYITAHLYPNISTAQIYALMKKFLNTHHPPAELRYNLKKALLSLGPSGFPFEKYFALLLTKLGYQTQTNQIIQGKCVSHEIDVLAHKNNTTYFVEAKYHNQQHLKSDVKVSLYVHARYLDIVATQKYSSPQMWLATNTHFTQEALTFAHCVSMKITTWSYPRGQGLKDFIEQTHFYPITILELSPHLTQTLLQEGIVTCQQLLTSSSHLPLSRQTINYLRKKAALVCAA